MVMFLVALTVQSPKRDKYIGKIEELSYEYQTVILQNLEGVCSCYDLFTSQSLIYKLIVGEQEEAFGESAPHNKKRTLSIENEFANLRIETEFRDARIKDLEAELESLKTEDSIQKNIKDRQQRQQVDNLLAEIGVLEMSIADKEVQIDSQTKLIERLKRQASSGSKLGDEIAELRSNQIETEAELSETKEQFRKSKIQLEKYKIKIESFAERERQFRILEQENSVLSTQIQGYQQQAVKIQDMEPKTPKKELKSPKKPKFNVLESELMRSQRLFEQQAMMLEKERLYSEDLETQLKHADTGELWHQEEMDLLVEEPFQDQRTQEIKSLDKELGSVNLRGSKLSYSNLKQRLSTIYDALKQVAKNENIDQDYAKRVEKACEQLSEVQQEVSAANFEFDENTIEEDAFLNRQNMSLKIENRVLVSAYHDLASRMQFNSVRFTKLY